MVVAGAAVTPAFAIDSVIRAAAFPVGAAKARRKPGFVSCRYFTARAIVCVFPVPGPPVRIENCDLHIANTASLCSLRNSA